MTSTLSAKAGDLFTTAGDWPELRSISARDDDLELAITIPASLACFAGHFPQQAVLPGVVQLLWVCRVAESLLGYADFRALKNIKYNGMILPGDDLLLRLRPADSETTPALRFHLERNEERVTLGAVTYERRLPTS